MALLCNSSGSRGRRLAGIEPHGADPWVVYGASDHPAAPAEGKRDFLPVGIVLRGGRIDESSDGRGPEPDESERESHETASDRKRRDVRSPADRDWLRACGLGSGQCRNRTVWTE